MLKLLKYLYHNTIIGKFIISKLLNLHRNYRIYCIGEERFIKQNFKKVFGVLPNLENPKTFNEKINWLKLNDRTQLHTICADKYAVRNYVKEKIGEEFLIPLVFQSYNVSDVIPSNFPEYAFIIKTNHDSSGGIIVKDKYTVSWRKINEALKKLLKKNYYYASKEWQYKNIKPCILAEKLLVSSDGDIPFDYKFHCFHGQVEIIQVDIDRYTNHKRNLYNVTWELLPFTWSMWKNNMPLWTNRKEIKRPKMLDEMIIAAQRLSTDFKYVRIDLYELNNTIYFGEMTFHHGGGLEIIHPREWDTILGNKLQL